jgi:hypothetical protein
MGNSLKERLRMARSGARAVGLAVAAAAAIALAIVPAGGEVNHGVFVLDCYDSGFDPREIVTDKGRSTIFIHNATNTSNQTYTIARKRPGKKKKKILFQGGTIPGQSIAGDTKFASGDVFIITETTTGNEARITVR